MTNVIELQCTVGMCGTKFFLVPFPVLHISSAQPSIVNFYFKMEFLLKAGLMNASCLF
jgi:hypothetical protein